MNSNWFAIVKFATAKLKMTLLAGFTMALRSTAIRFFDRHGNRSFLLLQTVDLFVTVVDVLDVSVQETAAFPPSERLAFEGIVLMQLQILVAVEEAFEAHQRSNEESNVWRFVTVQIV